VLVFFLVQCTETPLLKQYIQYGRDIAEQMKENIRFSKTFESGERKDLEM
jgi:hypothetical protein